VRRTFFSSHCASLRGRTDVVISKEDRHRHQLENQCQPGSGTKLATLHWNLKYPQAVLYFLFITQRTFRPAQELLAQCYRILELQLAEMTPHVCFELAECKGPCDECDSPAVLNTERIPSIVCRAPCCMHKRKR
jgi:hypothetical protein